MKSKKYMIISIIAVVVVIIGATFALVYFRGETTNVNLTFDANLGEYINYVNGNATISGDTLNVGYDYTSGISTEIEFWKKEEAKGMDIFGHIYLDIDAGSETLLNSPALKWAVVSNDILLGEGKFIGYRQGDSIPILVNQKLLSSLTKYKIFVWLDENEVINASSGENFTVTIRCEATTGEFDKFGGIYEYNYSGEIETITLRPGAYNLEVWGAQGGYAYNETYRGGYGGYSSGIINFSTSTNLYIVVGGQGGNGLTKVNTLNAGGYNGGGNSYGTTSKYVSSGGGATHIALSTGLLSELSESTGDILIVAGGGGGSGYENTTRYGMGGSGGGYIGTQGIRIGGSSVAVVGQGGTQIAGGTGHIVASFGQGANATSDSIGGGGGFYGGGGGNYYAGGGGGSGYIGNPLLTNKVMYCHDCQDSSEETDETNIKTVSTTEVNEAATPNQAKIGNGYARITAISFPVIKSLQRKTIIYGTNYDFKTNIINELSEGYSVIYSTYNNASSLSRGEYQIRYIVKDTNGNEFNYYQKIDVIGG